MKKLMELSDYCRWNDTDRVLKILEQASNIDVMYENGKYFRFAIKNDNPQILDKLLQTLERAHYDLNSESFEYKKYKEQINHIIYDAVDTFGISKKLEQVLVKHGVGLDTEEFGIDNRSLSKITEVSNEQSSISENNTLITSVNTKTFISQFNNISSIYDKIMDILFDDNALLNKNHYTHEFKYAVQNLLAIRSVGEVKDILDQLKDALSVARVPSESTLYKWKQSIENLPEPISSIFSQSSLEASSLENLTDKSAEKVEFLLGKNTLDFGRDDNLPEPYVELAGGTLHHEGEDF